MRTITRFAAAILAAIGLSASAWADIIIDNTAALTDASATAAKGNYDVIQFQLDDDRMRATNSETSELVTLDDTVWVKHIAVLQRPDNSTIANNTRLRIRKVLTTNATTGFLATESDTIIAESEPLADGGGKDLEVAGETRKLRTFTFAAPVPLLKSSLYSIRPVLNGSEQEDALVLTVFTKTGTTNNLNTMIHVDTHFAYSPCVRIIAVEPSKLADIGASANWSGLWPEAPTETDTVDLNVTAANAALTMDTPATVAGLAIGSKTAVGPLTLTGTGSLSSTTTTIATDTDVSDITANLGTVTVDSGKKLTVGDKGAFTSLTGTGGTLALDATDASISYTNTDAELEALRTYNGKVIFKGTAATGVTLPYAIGKGTMSAKFAFDGGTHNFQYGASSERVLFGPQGTDEDPTLEVKNGATLNFCTRDLSGWKSSQNSENVIVRVREGGTLNFTQYSNQQRAQTTYFNNRLVLDNGARVTAANMGDKFRLNGGVRRRRRLNWLCWGEQRPRQPA